MTHEEFLVSMTNIIQEVSFMTDYIATVTWKMKLNNAKKGKHN